MIMQYNQPNNHSMNGHIKYVKYVLRRIIASCQFVIIKTKTRLYWISPIGNGCRSLQYIGTSNWVRCNVTFKFIRIFGILATYVELSPPIRDGPTGKSVTKLIHVYTDPTKVRQMDQSVFLHSTTSFLPLSSLRLLHHSTSISCNT